MTETVVKQRFAGIQCLRAVACLLVLTQHVTYFASHLKGLDFNAVLPLDLGKAGVCLFFTISGFVMGSCLGEGSRFLWNRVLRIYPPFWIAIAISAPLIGSIDSTWYLDAWSALLLPTDKLNGSYRIPYWTLCYEIAFYVVTYVAVLADLEKRQIAYACAAWIAAILCVDVFWPIGAPGSDAAALFTAQPGAAVLVSPVSIFYATGLLLSTSGLASVRCTFRRTLVAVGCCAYLLSLALPFSSPAPQYLVQSLCFSAILWAAIEMSGWPVTSKLGDWSYGAYLIHLMIIVVLASMLQGVASKLGFTALWFALMTPTILLAFVYGLAEHRIHSQWLKHIAGNRRVSTASQ